MKSKLLNSFIHRLQVIKSQLNIIDKIVIAGLAILAVWGLICLAF